MTDSDTGSSKCKQLCSDLGLCDYINVFILSVLATLQHFAHDKFCQMGTIKFNLKYEMSYEIFTDIIYAVDL